MPIRRLLVVMRWVPIIALAGVLLGYTSSLVSRGRSERATAGRVAAELGHREVFVFNEDRGSPIEYPGSAAILRRGGFNTRECHTSGDAFDCFPWAGISPARIVGPFIVDVRWGVAAAPLAGLGTRTRYLVLFGLVFPLWDIGVWVS